MSGLREILARAPHVLLDFDGPVCGVFSTVHAGDVADRLRRELGQTNAVIPYEVTVSDDPFAVLRYAASVGSDCAARIERLLALEEVEAVTVAPPTQGVADAIEAMRSAGHSVTIVSNNSATAVSAYLDAHGLSQAIAGVVGRTEPSPSLLKPSPFLVRRAIKERRTSPPMCVLVGDSVTDIAAARRAGTAVVAYANKPAKLSKLRQAEPDFIINAMSELTRAVKVL